MYVNEFKIIFLFFYMNLLNENSSIYEQPNDINIVLKKHQLAMLYKSLEIEEKYEMGVMKDKPGSGKTYVILTMINELRKKNNTTKKKVNVIIVPHNIYFQWIYSIEKLTEELSYIKFVEYEHLLNLYNHPEDLYKKDIILVNSAYYNVLASTMTNLQLNIDRLFIDEIDNVGNLINQSFNTKFTMFISASFDVKNNNGYFSKQLLDTDLEQMTILCDENFVNKQLNLDDPIYEKHVCSNIYVDKVLYGLLDNDEIKNVNACYFKINDKNYDQKIASNEVNLISLIFNENNHLIESFNNQLEDVNKNIKFYIDKKDKRNEYIEDFNKNMSGISKVFNLKKIIIDFMENYMDYFDFYIHPKLDFEYRDMYDILVEKRRNNTKEFRIYLNNLMDSIYHFYQLKINNQENGVNEENIYALLNVYQLLNNLIKNRPIEINKLFEDLSKLKEEHKLNEYCLKLINEMNDFDSYVLEFTDVLNNLKIVLKCDQLIDNLEKNKKEIILYKNHYELKKDQLVEKLKNNNMCPICYNSLEYETKIYLSECCTQKICTNCLEDWVIKMKKINCIYCNSENKNLEDYLILDKEHQKNEETNEEINYIYCNSKNKNLEDYLILDKEYQKNEEIKSQKKNNDDYIQYNYSKMHFLENYIIDLKNKNDKILLFSDFSNVFNNIQIICEQNNILYEDLEKGNMQDIEKAVVNYKYGNAKILLANSSLFSCGMNLENSTHIIFVHKIDDSILDQVLGRAQRLGRTCILKVLSLEYENEIESHKNSSVPFVEIEKNTTSIEKLENKTKIFNSIEELNNKVNEEIILPNYDEVLDINLDELLLNLDQDF
jgi:hypothetical protein